jgi:hypothetical protein
MTATRRIAQNPHHHKELSLHFTQKSGDNEPRFFVPAIYPAINSLRYLRLCKRGANQNKARIKVRALFGF